MSLAEKPIPRVLGRPNLMLGAEREPAMFLLMICVGIPMMSISFMNIALFGCIWVLGIGALRWMAKADPQMTKIYTRQIRQRAYYPAYSRPYRKL